MVQPASGMTRRTDNRGVIGRNTGRGSAEYDCSPFVARAFDLGEHAKLQAEFAVAGRKGIITAARCS